MVVLPFICDRKRSLRAGASMNTDWVEFFLFTDNCTGCAPAWYPATAELRPPQAVPVPTTKFRDNATTAVQGT
jgi:hypothetical protein